MSGSNFIISGDLNLFILYLAFQIYYAELLAFDDRVITSLKTLCFILK